MTRLLCALAVLAVVSSLSAAPVPKAVKKKVPDVTGTTWVSDENEVKLGVLEYTFLEGGKLSWHQVGRNDVSTVGSWKQEGEHLYWEVNGKYVDYDVDFADGQFAGGALNKTKLRWKITLTPKAEGK